MAILFFMAAACFIGAYACFWSWKKESKCTQAIMAEAAGYKRDVQSESLDYNLTVTYTVGEETFRKTLGRRFGQEEIRKQYPLGTPVQVYIDPKNPGYCTENPAAGKTGSRMGAVFGLLMGIFMLILFFAQLSG